jgi:C-terminal processing protease CtpA/Prc
VVRRAALAAAIGALVAAAGAQPAPVVPPAPAGEELSVARPPEGRELRLTVFEATVDLFEDYYWDAGRLDWQAWADRYRDDALAAEGRGAFDAVMRRMVNEIGDDHSRWLGLTGLEPGLAPLTSPLTSPGGQAGEELAQAQATPTLGLQVQWVSGAGLVVVRVTPGSPAEEAGLRRGDVIAAVGGRSLDDLGSTSTGLLLRASQGRRQVQLTVRRGGRETLEVSVQPRLVPEADLGRWPVAELLPDGVGYLYVPSFTLEGTGARAHELLAGLKAQGARSFVLDLRGNRGGSLGELGVLMGAFLEGEWSRAVSRGRVMWTAAFETAPSGGHGVALLRAADGRLVRSASVASPVRVTEPLVVLVDGGTSSAAEVAAAVLQATGRARVVGTPTSGNVEVVRSYLLPDRSQVLVAVANLEMPDGRPLDLGIVPDAGAAVDLRDLARGYDAPVAEGVRLLAGLPFSPGRWFSGP